MTFHIYISYNYTKSNDLGVLSFLSKLNYGVNNDIEKEQCRNMSRLFSLFC